MKVTRIRALRGPNLWSHHTSVEAIVACGAEELCIGAMAGFESRLRARFPAQNFRDPPPPAAATRKRNPQRDDDD